MAWPHHLQVGLKEWDSVCRALESGTQILLLRKGGIHESAGEFEIEHRQFLLFPTFLHQNATMLKPPAREGLQSHAAEPDEVIISSCGLVTDILEIKSRAQVDAIDSEHIWTAPLIDMRFNYRPKNPLYLVLVRAHRLHEPIKIANTMDYAGCKSWVPLTHEIKTGEALPVLDDVRFHHRRDTILKRIAEATV